MFYLKYFTQTDAAEAGGEQKKNPLRPPRAPRVPARLGHLRPEKGSPPEGAGAQLPGAA